MGRVERAGQGGASAVGTLRKSRHTLVHCVGLENTPLQKRVKMAILHLKSLCKEMDRGSLQNGLGRKSPPRVRFWWPMQVDHPNSSGVGWCCWSGVCTSPKNLTGNCHFVRRSERGPPQTPPSKGRHPSGQLRCLGG